MDAGRLAQLNPTGQTEIEIVNEIFNDVLDIHEYDNHLWVDDALSFKAGDEEEEDRAELEEEEEDVDEDESGLDDEDEDEN